MQLNAANFKQVLSQLPAVSRYTVAFSGGMDSHVLLVLLCQLRQAQPAMRLRALHVHHGLQAEADAWVSHCQRVCDALDIDLQVKHVQIDVDAGHSLEAAAREARYRVFEQVIDNDEAIVLAHHQDDQAETLLLQLLRGAGVAGLAAMPSQAPLGEGLLLRPLLDFTRQQIEQFATESEISWVEDPSNQATRFDRNFLRHQVMPVLQQRWPSVSATLSRVARQQAEASRLVEFLAEQDYQQAKGDASRSLSLTAILLLDESRQRNLLRYWIKTVCGLPLPDHRHLQRIQQDVLYSSPDSQPSVRWSDVEVRRYRDQLVVQQAEADVDRPLQVWPDLSQPCVLADGSSLTATLTRGQGIRPALLEGATVTVAFRQGGEQCEPAGRGHHHSLKKLFQEWGVPPWQRDRIPLLYVNDQLAQVVGYCICEPFQASHEENGLFIAQTGV